MDLPDDLALPLATGAPWWYWLGGRPAIDFVNTRRERWWRCVETLVTTDDLVAWLAQAELLDDGPAVTATRPQLGKARLLREAINAGIEATIANGEMPQRAIETISGWLPYAASHERLAAGPQGRPSLQPAPPADPVRHALALVALDAARMLGTDERARLRICAGETCSARFFDSSRAGTRRWCSMQGCGNVAKARRHRARATGGA